MKTPAIVFVAAALSALAVPLRADPAMPEGFVVEWRDESGFGWRETGRVGLPLTEAVSLLAGTMKAQGYRLKHDIFDEKSPNPDRHLFLWVKPGEEAMVMAWAIGAAATGISWGATHPGAQPASRPRPAERRKPFPTRNPTQDNNPKTPTT